VPNELPVLIATHPSQNIDSLEHSEFSASERRGIATMKVPEWNNRMSVSGLSESAELPRPQLTVLVATNDSEIHTNISDILQFYPFKTSWATGMEGVRTILARENVAACLCGFWLVDGTYRDVVRVLRSQRAEIPTIIVCAPSCPHEYRDYLAALNIRAFDFICHPYQKADVERILHSAIRAPLGSPSPVSPIPMREVSGLRQAS
jgi:CheY-like chemotaxis protein